jgi:hypothetical protein
MQTGQARDSGGMQFSDRQAMRRRHVACKMQLGREPESSGGRAGFLNLICPSPHCRRKL